MRIPRALHPWNVTPKEAVAIQRALAGRVLRRGSARGVRLIAGVDVAFRPPTDEAIAGVVVWDVAGGCVVEQRVVGEPVRFPYVPGLLSFREAPVILKVLRRLRCAPDAFIFDAHGFAHPRRFGLACHVGVLLDRPSVGCAKSLLIGDCDTPGPAKGSVAPIEHDGVRIGMAVRTRDRVKPIYVSVGHRLSLDAAVRLTLAACNGLRLPEPTRLADILVRRAKAGVSNLHDSDES